MSIYQQYGLRQIINASGKMTALGASAVDATVAKALAEAAMDYVDIAELMAAAGKVIAKATGAQDGCPTAGAAPGIAISVAAAIAGNSLSLIERLPDSEGLKNEVILQKGHAVHFGACITQMIALGGGRPAEVGQANHVERQHIEEAFTPKTAALLYVKSHHAVQKGMQSIAVMAAIAKERGVPLIVDAAAEEDLRKYIAAGADLVIYSGGKAIGGPTSGFICGRQDLIRACRAQYKGVGRAMKVGKEAMIGLMTALEQYDKKPDDAAEQKQRMRWLLDQLAGTPGIRGEIVQDESGRDIFRAQLTLDPKVTGLNAEAIIRQLEQGSPAIYTRNHYANLGMIHIDPRPLLPGQEEIIASRIKELIRQQGGK